MYRIQTGPWSPNVGVTGGYQRFYPRDAKTKEKAKPSSGQINGTNYHRYPVTKIIGPNGQLVTNVGGKTVGNISFNAVSLESQLILPQLGSNHWFTVSDEEFAQSAAAQNPANNQFMLIFTNFAAELTPDILDMQITAKTRQVVEKEAADERKHQAYRSEVFSQLERDERPPLQPLPTIGMTDLAGATAGPKPNAPVDAPNEL